MDENRISNNEYEKIKKEQLKCAEELNLPHPNKWSVDDYNKFLLWEHIQRYKEIRDKEDNSKAKFKLDGGRGVEGLRSMNVLGNHKKDNLVMEKRNSKQEKEIDIPEGWEVKRIDGTKIVIGEKETEEKEEDKLPKTWDECIRIFEEFDRINVDSEVVKVGMSNPVISYGKKDYKLLPVGLGEPMLALSQLLICRNAWWKELGWNPYAGGEEVVYCIVNHSGYITKMAYDKSVIRILMFPTAEVRDKFLKTFRDLIEKAKDLL